jgi:hypothetical protein
MDNGPRQKKNKEKTSKFRRLKTININSTKVKNQRILSGNIHGNKSADNSTKPPQPERYKLTRD